VIPPLPVSSCSHAFRSHNWYGACYRSSGSFFSVFVLHAVLTFSQNSIQDELTKRGYSPDAGESNNPANATPPLNDYQDPVMAEYITIMIINNKSPGKKPYFLSV
jgi:hypothetical protein